MTYRNPLTRVRKTSDGWQVTPTTAWPEHILPWLLEDSQDTTFQEHSTAVHLGATVSLMARRAAVERIGEQIKFAYNRPKRGRRS